MTEQHQAQTLMTALRDALQEIEEELGRMRQGIDAIDALATRLREGLAALGALRQDAIAAVGIDMVIDAATELLQACNDLEATLPDAQADVETLEAEMEDEQDGRNA
jgi:DNA repair exonuclease SbcCD ATPase subunit